MNWFKANTSHTPRIMVVGDAMVDQYVMGDVSRISPEAPIPILLVHAETDKLGGAANVAANVVAMGGTARLVCVVGDDQGGDRLANLMARANIAHHPIVDHGYVTTQKTRVVCGTQQLVRIDRESQPSAAATAALVDLFERHANDADFVVFADYAKGSLQNLPQLLRLARSLGLRSLVDPKVAQPERYRGAFILKPNEHEFRALFGEFSEDDLVSRAQVALHTYDIDHIVMTRGAKGMILISADGQVVRRPTEAQEVFDVSGAGDTVAAALALAIVGGHPMESALSLSNIAAGIAVAHLGTYAVTSTDIELHLARQGNENQKLVSRSALRQIVDEKRRSGAKIVFTNGCFDVLHSGHVRALNAAKREGSVLIVGLNGDESVKRLKGPTRPINSFRDRAEVLIALMAVDFVTEFTEDTPYELIKDVMPDVLVKSGDYSLDQIVGAELVLARGGRVVRGEYHEGYSSTRVLSQLSV